MKAYAQRESFTDALRNFGIWSTRHLLHLFFSSWGLNGLIVTMLAGVMNDGCDWILCPAFAA